MGLFNRVKQTNDDVMGIDDPILRAALNSGTLTRNEVKGIPEVAACLDLITSTFALIPCRLYRKEEDKTVEVPDDERVRLLNIDTGDTLDAFQFKKALCEDYFVGYNGGGYAYINKRKNTVKSLHYVKSEDVQIASNTDPIFKNYSILVNAKEYDKSDFLKLLRNSRDGMTGDSITEEITDALQAAYSLIRFELQTFRKGGNKKGFLISKRRIGKEEIDALRNAWNSLYSTESENIPVLNEGLEFKESSNSAAELQLNQNKTTLNREIDNLFHVTDDQEAFIRRAILPIGTAFETALNRDLLLEKEKGTYFWALDYSELIKASIRERYEAYASAKNAGWLMINEIREMENLEAVEGMNVLNVGLGAALYNTDDGTYYVPNTDTAEKQAQKNEKESEETNENE